MLESVTSIHRVDYIKTERVKFRNIPECHSAFKYLSVHPFGPRVRNVLLRIVCVIQACDSFIIIFLFYYIYLYFNRIYIIFDMWI